jgi:class 3 adenylate cyclase
MATFRTRRSDYKAGTIGDSIGLRLPKARFQQFDAGILGLGDISRASDTTEAVCAIFDLGGFTDFSRQVDPHLAVPAFMTAFLGWLFREVREQSVLTDPDDSDTLLLYSPLPFFAKFMGDGVLFLWNVETLHIDALMNIAPTLGNITMRYQRDLLPQVRRIVADPPDKLRVGLARGRVLSIGNGSDFVGPAINLSARLQKLIPSLTFCCSGRGFDFEHHDHAQSRERLVLKLASVRGIGERELVYVLRDEYDALGNADKALLKDP